MTIAADSYFRVSRDDRKKEPRYLAVIDKDSCTSCNACATVCPVDCIYEVVNPTPAHSFHVIDTRRCIGCQLCYRIPAESTAHYTLAVCPWNAIDMLHNPNHNGSWILKDYYLGDETLPWGKLDEYGFQLAINGELRMATESEQLNTTLAKFGQAVWGREDDRRSITRPARSEKEIMLYETTAEGRELLKFLFRDYTKVFLD